VNLKDTGARFVTGLHRAVFDATSGRLLGRMAGMPVLALTTRGRKTGKPRTTMLTSPVQDGDSIVLVASYGGDDRHPRWFTNLEADPQVEIVMKGRRSRMRARVASPAERERLWPQVTGTYGGYAAYQRRTDRNIPLVILEPEDNA